MEKVIEGMRWKCLEFYRKLNCNNVESPCFKSVKCPTAIQEMTDFENNLQQMINSVEVREIRNGFQGKLKYDIQHIKQSKRFLV